jgi:hypothetical protein
MFPEGTALQAAERLNVEDTGRVPLAMGQKRILQMLSLHAQRLLLLAPDFATCNRALDGAAPSRFPAMYVGANMGHRSRKESLVLCSNHAPPRNSNRFGVNSFTVAQFVIEREVPGAGSLSDVQIREMSLRSLQALSAIGPQIQWLHSYVTEDKVYCVYLAPDEDTIREHARRAGIPADRVSAVRRLIDPAALG